MVTLTVSIDELLRAKADGKKDKKLELELDVAIQDEAKIQCVITVQQVVSRYRVSFGGIAYEQVEKMCRHIRYLGSDKVMIQIGEFPFRDDLDETTPVHIDVLGIKSVGDDRYEFFNFIYDNEFSVQVETSAITHCNEEFGPRNYAINPIDSFEGGIIGYGISAGITDRLDGSSEGIIVVNSRERRIAKEVHQEVFDALRTFYNAKPVIKNASTKALEHVCNTSKHKALIMFDHYQ